MKRSDNWSWINDNHKIIYVFKARDYEQFTISWFYNDIEIRWNRLTRKCEWNTKQLCIATVKFRNSKITAPLTFLLNPNSGPPEISGPLRKSLKEKLWSQVQCQRISLTVELNIVRSYLWFYVDLNWILLETMINIIKLYLSGSRVKWYTVM